MWYQFKSRGIINCSNWNGVSFSYLLLIVPLIQMNDLSVDILLHPTATLV